MLTKNMTNETEKSGVENFSYALSEYGELAKASDRLKHTRETVKERAEDTLRAYAHSIARELEPDYNKNPDEMTSKELKGYIEFGQKRALTKATKILDYNLDVIVGSELPAKGLEEIVANKDFLKQASQTVKEKDAENLARYSSHVQLMKSVRLYMETGKFAGKEQRGEVLELAAYGAAEVQRKKMKEEGFGRELQNLAAQLAEISIKSGNYSEDKMREFLTQGIEKQSKDYETELKDGQEVARKTLKEMVKSEDPKIHNTAVGLIDFAFREKLGKEDTYKFPDLIRPDNSEELPAAA